MHVNQSDGMIGKRNFRNVKEVATESVESMKNFRKIA